MKENYNYEETTRDHQQYLADFLKEAYETTDVFDDLEDLEPLEPEMEEQWQTSDYDDLTDLADMELVEESPWPSDDSYETEQSDRVQPGVLDPAKYTYKSQRPARLGRGAKLLLRIGAVIMALAALYCVCVFSNIPFIKKWRNLYIETAMSTMTHQWLAEAFIPESVIYQAMKDYDELNEFQDDLETDWGASTGKVPPITTVARPDTPDEPGTSTDPSDPTTSSPWLDADHPIYTLFHELDIASFAEYMEDHPDAISAETGMVMIDESDRHQNGTTIKTTAGDEVLAVDERNGILIVKITGEGYMGRIALVKDPSRVAMGTAKNLGESGSQLKYIASYNDAILAINANGFEDPDGHGNGGHAYGYVLADNAIYNDAVGQHYKVVGFDFNDRMYIGKYKDDLILRDAGEFTPALVINGEKVVEGSAGWGIQPRCAIGQAQDGTVLMLVIDGRQMHSVGATVEDAADQLLKYGAWQACNLDGGSSAVMYYNGRTISQPSAADKTDGRLLPCGFIVRNLT